MKTSIQKRIAQCLGILWAALCGTGISTQALTLTPLTTFGPNGDGSPRPGDVPFLTVGGTVTGDPYLNTQILMASRRTQVAILTPTDSEITTFVSAVLDTDTPAGALGTGLCFGP